DREVPDLCPPELLMPNSEEYLGGLMPHPEGKVSPVELSWLLFDRERSLHIMYDGLRDFLQLVRGRSDKIQRFHDEVASNDFWSHDLRIFARVALDPRRYETFRFEDAFDLDQNKISPRISERFYFMDFHEEYGVVERD